MKILETRCADCHREDETPILYAGINLFSLRATEGEPENILDRVTRADGVKGRMPKSTGKPVDPGHVAPLTAEEIAALTVWAQGDSKPTEAAAPVLDPAPRPFVPLREEIRIIAADVAGLDPALRPFSRYLTLTNLANGTDTGEPQLETYRAALSKLLNSLSRGAGTALPPVHCGRETPEPRAHGVGGGRPAENRHGPGQLLPVWRAAHREGESHRGR